MKKFIPLFFTIVFLLYGCSSSSVNEVPNDTGNIASDDISIPSSEQVQEGFFISVNEWVSMFNDLCNDEMPYEPIEVADFENHLDNDGIFRYSMADWITLVIYPNNESSAIESISVRYNPAGQKGPWILRVFSLNEFLLEVTYPSIDSTQADAVSTYYEDTLYSGSWNWPEKGNKGLYDKNGITCDIYRTFDSLVFDIIP